MKKQFRKNNSAEKEEKERIKNEWKNNSFAIDSAGKKKEKKERINFNKLSLFYYNI